MRLSFRLRDSYTDRQPICGSPGQGGLVRGGSRLLAAGLVLMTTGSLRVVGSHADVRQWAGDSRGRWDEDTLIVDTTNFYADTDFFAAASFRGASSQLHLIERFTRVGADTLLYEFTVDDPATWTGKWTAQLPMTKTTDMIFEY